MDYFKANFFILFLISTVQLSASEPMIAELIKIQSSSQLLFRYKNTQFLCQNYGVIDVDTMYNDTNISKECRKRINDFYIYNPKSKNIAYYNFSIYQLYHVEIKNNKCLVFLKGSKTYSQYLIELGLAKPKPFFADKKYRQRFKNAFYEAKLVKQGYHKNPFLKNCMNNYGISDLNLRE